MTVRFNQALKSIGNKAFQLSGIKEAVLPASLLSIGDEAFSGCEGLGYVVIGDGVKTIGQQAFYNCHQPHARTPPRMGP